MRVPATAASGPAILRIFLLSTTGVAAIASDVPVTVRATPDR